MKIEHRLGVAAPADVIWEVLSDIPSWPQWNPLYPKADGVIRIGSVLDLDVAIEGQPVRPIKPVVLDWAPYDHLHWRLSMANGMIKSVRYLEIEPLSDTGCIFSNGEIFGGLLTPFVIGPMRYPIRRGFEALGEALKVQAEALWQDRQQAPTS